MKMGKKNKRTATAEEQPVAGTAVAVAGATTDTCTVQEQSLPSTTAITTGRCTSTSKRGCGEENGKRKRKKKKEHRGDSNISSRSVSEKEQKATEIKQILSEEGDRSKIVASSTTASTQNKADEKGKGIDEIDALFASKKETELMQKKQEAEEEKMHQEQRKLFQKNRNSGGGVSKKNVKNIDLSQDRTDIGKIQRGEWANDGLGGVFDVDGFTGRKQEGTGYKIYKAHLFNKEGFGTTKDCPFDCKCCYI